MKLVWPSSAHLPSYVKALERGWSPDNLRGDVAAREELARIATDAEAFLASLIDIEATGLPIVLPDGTTVPRLPGYRRWLWDDEFCGSIGFRWQPGTEALPPYCLGHIGYSVVPWKQRRGYATRALREVLEDARARGLRYVEIATAVENAPSKRVIEANGGVLVEEFITLAALGGERELRYRVSLNDAAEAPRPWIGNAVIRAILFDLGNTLVGYYTSREFPDVLRRCLRECAAVLGWSWDLDRDDEVFERALALNREQPDFAVRPLQDRLRELFAPYGSFDDASAEALATAFLKPIFATARLEPTAISVLESLRGLGIKSAIVSNTPWGSPANAWREELARHGLLDKVNAAVFCVDVGWRKPHRAPFDRALALLDVAPGEALFVGDDRRWDVIGAQNAGVRPVLLAPHSTDSFADHLTIRSLGDVVSLAKGAS